MPLTNLDLQNYNMLNTVLKGISMLKSKNQPISWNSLPATDLLWKIPTFYGPFCCSGSVRLNDPNLVSKIHTLQVNVLEDDMFQKNRNGEAIPDDKVLQIGHLNDLNIATLEAISTEIDLKNYHLCWYEPSQFSDINYWHIFSDSVFRTIEQQIKSKMNLDKIIQEYNNAYIRFKKNTVYIHETDEIGDLLKINNIKFKTNEFATLLICIPSYHEGGEIIVKSPRKNENEIMINFGGELSNNSNIIQYAAFYNNCIEEIKPITKGKRIIIKVDICNDINGKYYAFGGYKNHNIKDMIEHIDLSQFHGNDILDYAKQCGFRNELKEYLMKIISINFEMEYIGILLQHKYFVDKLEAKHLIGRDYILYEIICDLFNNKDIEFVSVVVYEDVDENNDELITIKPFCLSTQSDENGEIHVINSIKLTNQCLVLIPFISGYEIDSEQDYDEQRTTFVSNVLLLKIDIN
eukprot:407402_1